MRKKDVLKLFGNNQAELARAVNLTRGRISQWPDELEQREADLVIGACVRLGKDFQGLLAGITNERRMVPDRRASRRNPFPKAGT